VTILGPGWRTVAYDFAAPYSGYAKLDGPFELELFVSPAVSMPGQMLTVDIRLTNTQGVATAPGIRLKLPDGLTLDRNDLPSGTTMNLQTGELSWLPFSAGGGVQEIRTQLRVERADIAQPELAITAILEYEDGEQELSAPIWVGIAPQINTILNAPQVAVGQPVRFRADIDGSGPFALWPIRAGVGSWRRPDAGRR
jgi:hypothetical protein